MTIGSPVGVVTTYTFTPDGTLQSFLPGGDADWIG